MDSLSHPHRYDRNASSISVQEQELLARKRVAVIGCGGLGGYVIEQLARAGVGSLVLVDSDVFEQSNLNRQLLCTEQDLGESKALVAAKRVAAIDASVACEPHCVWLDEGNAGRLIEGCDCVVDCLDGVQARFVLSRACLQASIPLVYGAIAGWYGQVATVYPGDVLYSTVYGQPEDSSDELASRQLGNLAPACAVTAGFQAAECLKVLLGKGVPIRNSLLMIDLLDGSCETL